MESNYNSFNNPRSQKNDRFVGSSGSQDTDLAWRRRPTSPHDRRQEQSQDTDLAWRRRPTSPHDRRQEQSRLPALNLNHGRERPYTYNDNQVAPSLMEINTGFVPGGPNSVHEGNRRGNCSRTPGSSKPTNQATNGRLPVTEQHVSSNKSSQNGSKKFSAIQINSRSGKPRFVGFKFLKELSEMESHSMLFTIKNPESGFSDILDADEVLKNPDWLMLLFQIIKSICMLELRGSKHEILCQICESKQIENLKNYLALIVFEKDTRVREAFPSFIDSLVMFYKTVIDVIPTVAVEKDFQFLIKVTKKAIRDLKLDLGIHTDELVVKQLNVLEEKMEENLKNRARPDTSRKKQLQIHEMIGDLPPPEDFRELSLYPTPIDLTLNKFGFVRPNIKKGKYNDVEHYLDVQFRLLREDFIDPLRRGIKKYMDMKLLQPKRTKNKYENIRFYTVQFEGVDILKKNGSIAYVVNFDLNKRMGNVKWEYSKRFMYGSLLLFTNDDFHTFFCCKVVDRDLAKLKDGRILVTVAEGFNFEKDFFNRPFLMAESDVFFEPYFLVMKALKFFTKENFPMTRYIVDGYRFPEYPEYVYKFVNPQYDIEQFKTDLFNPETWPSAVELKLDIYQYHALKAALTRDFAIIQGPPGTGKTFLGLKIVKTLLANIRLNPNTVRLPILVVCFTNHALDQFLEGILEFTKLMVRIGSQSKNEELEPFNLRGKNNLAHLRNNKKDVGQAMRAHRFNIQYLLYTINELNGKKKIIENPYGVFNRSVIAHLMSEAHREVIKDDEDMVKWLFDDNTDDQEVENEIGETSPTEKDADQDDASADEEDDDDDDGVRDLMETNCLVDEDDIFRFESNSEADLAQESRNYYVTTKILRKRYDDEKQRNDLLLAQIESGAEVDYGTMHNEIYESTQRVKNLAAFYGKLVKLLNFRAKCDLEIKEESVFNAISRIDPYDIPREFRWGLYWSWIDKLLNNTLSEIQKCETKYRKMLEEYEEMKQMEDMYLVKKCEIVGMTTTCAARVQSMLRELKPSIVIVEEAAEVLESHIVTALTKDTEHVILIGDHKQLRPSSAVYELSKNYNIDISLFKRMINNQMDCHMLNVQHRMRPEISCLITPFIYPNLENHNSVYEYEPVPGITKSLFFVEHTVFEQDVEDSTSRKNIHEADFMLQLCRYIYLQGYEPSRITILTTYIGQMFYLREQRKRKYPLLQDVKIIVVDKYQGEENDIILLSLVRSNTEAKIGFLKTENRVCVALSRARKGLFIIGNMDNLSKSSPLWQNIKETLQRQNAIGKELTLFCSVHKVFTPVSKESDFIKVKEGGCHNICGTLLDCGHDCKKLCHVLEREHTNYKCFEPCPKLCPAGHQCANYCYQECARCTVSVTKFLPCGHEKVLPCYLDEKQYKCLVTVDLVLPLCQHKAQKKCHEAIEDVKCPEPCIGRLDCGHSCVNTCHKYNDPEHKEYQCNKPCEKLNKKCSREHMCKKLCFEECGNCTIKVTFVLNCGHKVQLQCSANLSIVKCYDKCDRFCISCKQRCRKMCHQDCQPCENVVEKTIPDCQHKVRIKCKDQPTRKKCKERCERTAPCGHKCKGQCAIPCEQEKCQEIVFASPRRMGQCGHPITHPCYDREIEALFELPDEYYLKYCRHPCDTLLKCEHVCSGTCGECYQGKLHVSCKEDCQNTLICGHACESPCREICPPCKKKCEFKCVHSECIKKCGVPCVKCEEPCQWRCKHSRCTRKCGETCNRKPCEENCDKILPCGHPCIGFCGEPCPPKCRVCDKDEVTEIIFGFEDEPDARFVYLEDCKHIIVSDALDQFLSMAPEGGEIIVKVCPLCKTPITKTLRYMNYVKETYQHILNIKKKIYGSKDVMKTVIAELKEKVGKISNVREKFNKAGLHEINNILTQYSRKLQKPRKGPLPISREESKVMQYVTHLLQNVQSRLDEIVQLERGLALKKSKYIIRFLLITIDPHGDKVNPQQVDDSLRELNRFHRMVDFGGVLSTYLYKQNQNDEKVMELKNSIESILYKCSSYSKDDNEEIKKKFVELAEQLKLPKGITQEEKRMVHLAIFGSGSNSGHWFTCTNGHYYCITECGGAMEKANCPECGETIGGENHVYVPTIRVATDMDGATRPAWPPRWEPQGQPRWQPQRQLRWQPQGQDQWQPWY